MSNRLIQQLKQITRVEIPEPPQNFTKVEIPKQEVLLSADIKAGDKLLIEVPDYIINPSGNFDLHKKWNRGIAPKDSLMQVFVVQCMGNMIQVKSNGFDAKTQSSTNNLWDGWLPRASIKVKYKY